MKERVPHWPRARRLPDAIVTTETNSYQLLVDRDAVRKIWEEIVGPVVQAKPTIDLADLIGECERIATERTQVPILPWEDLYVLLGTFPAGGDDQAASRVRTLLEPLHLELMSCLAGANS